MKRTVLLGLPCVLLLAGCLGDGGGDQAYESNSSGGYASDSGSKTYSKSDYSSSYSTSRGDPRGGYPINNNGFVKTNCPDGSCNSR